MDLSALVKKLAHHLVEIRERALKNILSKLDHNLLSFVDLVQEKPLFLHLLQWFNFPAVPMKEEVLLLLNKLVKHSSAAQWMIEIGAVDFLTQLRPNVEPNLQALVDGILDGLFLLPTDISNNHLSSSHEVKSLPTYNFAAIQHQADLTDGYFHQDACVLQHSSVSTEQSCVNYSPATCLKYSTFPWLTLTTTDRHVLSSNESTLQSSNQGLIWRSCQLLQDVVMQDFPAEIFLQRPKIVQSLLSLLGLASETDGQQHLAFQSISCLLQLCILLRNRLNFHRDPGFVSTKQEVFSQNSSVLYCQDARRNSQNPSPANEQIRPSVLGRASQRLRGDGQDGDATSSSGNSIQAHTISRTAPWSPLDIGHQDLQQIEREDPLESQFQQLSLAQFCVSLLENAATLLQSDKRKLITRVVELLSESVALLNDAISEHVWEDTSLIGQELRCKLRFSLDTLGEAILYHKNKSGSELTEPSFVNHRMAFISISLFTMRLLQTLLPVEKANDVLPESLMNALFLISLDLPFRIAYPSVHESVTAFMEQLNSEDYGVYKQASEVAYSIECTTTFMSCSSKEGAKDFLELVELAEKALTSLPYHKHFPFVRKFIGICSDIYKSAQSGPVLLEESQKVLLRLLSHWVSAIKAETYTCCLEIVKDSLGIENATKTVSSICHGVHFLLQPNVLYEICTFGLQDSNVEISSTAKTILTFLLQGRLVMTAPTWNKFLDALCPVLSVLQGFADTEDALGSSILSLCETSQNGEGVTPKTTRLRAALRLMFAKKNALRSLAIKWLSIHLMNEEESNVKRPELQGSILSKAVSLYILERPLDLKLDDSGKSIFKAETVTKVAEIFKSEKVDMSLQKSAAEQLAVIAQDLQMHPILKNMGVAEKSVNILQKCVHKDGKVFECIVLPCITLLREMIYADPVLRLSLAQDPCFLLALFRVTLFLQEDSSLLIEAAALLSLLLFDEISQLSAWSETVSGPAPPPFGLPVTVVRRQQNPDRKFNPFLARDILHPKDYKLFAVLIKCSPQKIYKTKQELMAYLVNTIQKTHLRFHLPVSVSTHHAVSPYTMASPLSLEWLTITSVADMLRMAWNLSWYQGVDNLLSKMASDQQEKESFLDTLKLSPEEVLTLKMTHSASGLQDCLNAIIRAVSHREVRSAVARMNFYLLNDRLVLNCLTGSNMSSLKCLPWHTALSRFLLVYPACAEDEKLLADVISFLNKILREQRGSSDSQDLQWMLEMLLKQSPSPLLDLIVQKECLAKKDLDDTQAAVRQHLQKELMVFFNTLMLCLTSVTDRGIFMLIGSFYVDWKSKFPAIVKMMECTLNSLIALQITCMVVKDLQELQAHAVRFKDGAWRQVDQMVSLLKQYKRKCLALAGSLRTQLTLHLLQSLKVSDVPNFYGLPSLSRTLRGMAHVTSLSGWSLYCPSTEPFTVCTKLLTSLLEIISSFYVEWGGNALSYMGKGVTKSTVLCLLHLSHEMTVQAKNTDWVHLWSLPYDHGNEEHVIPRLGLEWLIPLWVDRDPEVRFTSLGIGSALTSLKEGALVLSESCQNISGGLWGTVLSIFLDQCECSTVRREAAFILQNMLVIPMPANPEDSNEYTLQGPCVYDDESGLSTVGKTAVQVLLDRYHFYDHVSQMVKSCYLGRYTYDFSQSVVEPKAITANITSSEDSLYIWHNAENNSSPTPESDSTISTWLPSTSSTSSTGHLHPVSASSLCENISDPLLDKDQSYKAGTVSLSSEENSASVGMPDQCSVVTPSHLSAICGLLENLLIMNPGHTAAALSERRILTDLSSLIKPTLLERCFSDFKSPLIFQFHTEVIKSQVMVLLEYLSALSRLIQTCLILDVNLVIKDELIQPLLTIMFSLLSVQHKKARDVEISSAIYQTWTDIFICLTTLLRKHIQTVTQVATVFTKQGTSLLGTVSECLRLATSHPKLYTASMHFLSVLLAEHGKLQCLALDSPCTSELCALLDGNVNMGYDLCKVILQSYEEKSSEDPLRQVCASTLILLLAVSRSAQKYSLQAHLVDSCIEQMKHIHAQLNLDSLRPGKPAQRKKEESHLKNLKAAMYLLRNSLYQNKDGKAAALDTQLAPLLHSLWPWLLMDDALMQNALHLLCVYTANYPAACSSVCWTNVGVMPVQLSQKAPANNSLMHSLLKIASEPASSNSSTQQAAFVLLSNLAATQDCKCLIQKSNFLQHFLSVSLPKGGAKALNILAVHWLKFLWNLSLATDGQQMIMKLKGSLDLLLELIKYNNKSDPPIALLILHNICFNTASKPKILSNDKAVAVISSCLESEDTSMQRIGASALWALLHNYQKAKVILKNPLLKGRIEEMLSTLRKNAMLTDDMPVLYHLKCLENLEQILNN